MACVAGMHHIWRSRHTRVPERKMSSTPFESPGTRFVAAVPRASRSPGATHTRVFHLASEYLANVAPRSEQLELAVIMLLRRVCRQPRKEAVLISRGEPMTSAAASRAGSPSGIERSTGSTSESRGSYTFRMATLAWTVRKLASRHTAISPHRSASKASSGRPLTSGSGMDQRRARSGPSETIGSRSEWNPC